MTANKEGWPSEKVPGPAVHEPRAVEPHRGGAMHRATVRSPSYLTRRLARTFAGSNRHMTSLLIQLDFRTGTFLISKDGERTGNRR